jgi:hypothetical protein
MSANRSESCGLELLRAGCSYCASVCFLFILIFAADAYGAAPSGQLTARLQRQMQWEQAQRLQQSRRELNRREFNRREFNRREFNRREQERLEEERLEQERQERIRLLQRLYRNR